MRAVAESSLPAKRKKLILWGFAGAMGVTGLLDATLPERVQSWPGISHFLLPILFTGFAYSWALNDAKEDGRVIAGKMSLFLLLIPVLGLPVYIISNKSPKQMLVLLFGFTIMLPPLFGYALVYTATQMILGK